MGTISFADSVPLTHRNAGVSCSSENSVANGEISLEILVFINSYEAGCTSAQRVGPPPGTAQDR